MTIGRTQWQADDALKKKYELETMFLLFNFILFSKSFYSMFPLVLLNNFNRDPTQNHSMSLGHHSKTRNETV